MEQRDLWHCATRTAYTGHLVGGVLDADIVKMYQTMVSLPQVYATIASQHRDIRDIPTVFCCEQATADVLLSVFAYS